MNRIPLISILGLAPIGAGTSVAADAAARRAVHADEDGGATRSADGQVAKNRATTATSAATGNTATTTASYNSGSGRTQTTAGFDAAGATIRLPGAAVMVAIAILRARPGLLR